jgi:hypothetical protein
MVFRGLQEVSQEQARAHEAVAHDLRTTAVNPFQQWAQGHKVCYTSNHIPITICSSRIIATGQIEKSEERSTRQLVAII